MRQSPSVLALLGTCVVIGNLPGDLVAASPEDAPPAAGEVVDGKARPRELGTLELRMAVLREQRVTVPYTAAVARLRAKYTAALDREIAARQRVGDLDTVLVLREEKALIAKGQQPLGDETTDPPALVPLRKIWRQSLVQPTADRDASDTALLRQYASALGKLETDLTRAGRVEDAVAARTARERLALALPGDGETAPASAEAARGEIVVAPPVPAELRQRPPRPAHTRELVEWALRHSDTTLGLIVNGQKRYFKGTDKRADNPLPEDDLVPFYLNLGDRAREHEAEFKPEWLLGETSFTGLRLDIHFNDYHVLRGMDKLELFVRYHVYGTQTDHLLQLPPLPGIRSWATWGDFDDEGIAILADRLPNVRPYKKTK